MDTKELVNKIAKLKNAIESESDPDVKKAYQKKVDALEKQIAEAEVKVEKVEAKAAAEEKKDLNEAEVKIQKLKAALASETDPDVKDRYQKKIKQLEETLKDVKQEIKEEKKEIAEQKKDIKAATKEVKSAQKEVRKTAIKKVAAKQVERKQVVTRKAKRKTKIKSIISDLDALINKNKELKAKYKGKGVDLKRDAGRSAKPFGYRFVGKHDYRVPTEAQVRKGLKRGTIDYEGRPNRSDKYPKATARLADGGMMMAKGGELKSHKVALYKNDKGGVTYIPLEGKERMYNKAQVKQLIKDVYGKTIQGSVSFEETKEWDDDMYKQVMGKKEDGGIMAKGGLSADERKTRRIEKYKTDKWNAPSKGYSSNSQSKPTSDAEMKETMRQLLVRNKNSHSRAKGRIELHNDGTIKDWNTFFTEYEKRFGKQDANTVTKAKANYDSAIYLAKGGTIKKKPSTSKPKPSKKVGKSVQDKHRFAKPAGWRWKEEAFQKRIIERKQLAMSPSKKMRDKYPDYVYYEDRLNKADAKPTRSSADSI